MNEPSKKRIPEKPEANSAQPGDAAVSIMPGDGSAADGDTASAARAKRGPSPYGTGGGDVTFAQPVASVYLASVLTGGQRRDVPDLPAA